MSQKESYEVLIVGGGSGGLSTAARLRNEPKPMSVGIVEPSDKHYYQPLWTLVGGGVFPREESERNEADFVPSGANWIRDAVSAIEPEQNVLRTRDGRELHYEFLIVAAGIKLEWDRVKGLRESVGKGGVVSNYSYETVSSTWEAIRSFKGGNAVFTQPAPPYKCGGAPQKIAYLADEAFRRNGVRDKTTITYASQAVESFQVPKYARALDKVIARKGIVPKYQHDLVEVRPDKGEAVFINLKDKSEVVLPYDLIHVTPPQGPPDFLRNSPLAGAGGWVDVDKFTLQHVRYPNVFSLGDCSSLPTSKTGAAIRKQAPVLVENLLSLRRGEPLTAKYDGYTSCPFVTGYGSLILAEFDYDKVPCESFPFDQGLERYSMYVLKAYGLPRMYWHGMLRGRL